MELKALLRAQEPCESVGGHGLPVPNSPCGLWMQSNIELAFGG